MKKCKYCIFLNYNCMCKRYEIQGHPFCGVHGSCSVDLESDKQMNLDGRGGCDYYPKSKPIQLSLFD